MSDGGFSGEGFEPLVGRVLECTRRARAELLLTVESDRGAVASLCAAVEALAAEVVALRRELAAARPTAPARHPVVDPAPDLCPHEYVLGRCFFCGQARGAGRTMR